MSNLSEILDGVETLINNNVTNSHVYKYPVQPNEFPAFVILFNPIDPILAFGGNTFEGSLRIVCLYMAGSSQEAYQRMYEGLDVTEANKSIVAALKSDHTLNAKADSSQITALENIGERDIGGNPYVGFDCILEFIKTVA